METLVLKMTFANDLGETAIVSIKDVVDTITESDIEDLMDKIILTGFLVKNTRATSKDSACLVTTIIRDFDITVG